MCMYGKRYKHEYWLGLCPTIPNLGYATTSCLLAFQLHLFKKSLTVFISSKTIQTNSHSTTKVLCLLSKHSILVVVIEWLLVCMVFAPWWFGMQWYFFRWGDCLNALLVVFSLSRYWAVCNELHNYHVLLII